MKGKFLGWSLVCAISGFVILLVWLVWILFSQDFDISGNRGYGAIIGFSIASLGVLGILVSEPVACHRKKGEKLNE